MKRASAFFLLLLFFGIFLSFFYQDKVVLSDLSAVMSVPGRKFFFGSDSLGRDLFWRVLAGGQISIFICLLSSLGSLFLGFLVGGISAFLPRMLDQFTMRFCEVLIATPHVINLALAAIFFNSFLQDSGVLAVGFSLVVCSWMPTARFIRNLIHDEKHKTYIEAAETMNFSKSRIVFIHILPNIKSTLIIYWGLMIPQAILAEGVLSFFGLGIKAPLVSWGALLQEGWRTASTFPHLLLIPGVVLTLTVFSINWLLEDWRKSLRVSYSYRESNS